MKCLQTKGNLRLELKLLKTLLEMSFQKKNWKWGQRQSSDNVCSLKSHLSASHTQAQLQWGKKQSCRTVRIARQRVGLAMKQALWKLNAPFFLKSTAGRAKIVFSAEFFLAFMAAYFGRVSWITHINSFSFQCLESAVNTKKPLSLSSKSNMTLPRCLGHINSWVPRASLLH